MITLILANGELYLSNELKELAQECELIIAADGGSRHCPFLECKPNYVIGDLDSISEVQLEDFQNIGIEIVKYPARKDATDLELALDHAVKEGATEIHLAGLLGGRWDMSLSNLLLLAQEKYIDISLTLYGKDCTMHILQPEHHTFQTTAGSTASLIPIMGDAEGVTLKGFEYPLDNYTIPFGSSIGLSNVTSEPEVEIILRSGVLLLIFQQLVS